MRAGFLRRLRRDRRPIPNVSELQKQQNLIARLYCDATFRERFASAPFEEGRRFGLADETITEIADVMKEEIDFFARSLVWKRRREAEKLLPIVVSLLGKDFSELFDDFAGHFIPDAARKHLQDAIEFTRFVERRSGRSEVVAAALYERTRLQFYAEDRRFAWCRVNALVCRLVRGVNGEGVASRDRIAVWIRYNGRVRHFFV